LPGQEQKQGPPGVVLLKLHGSVDWWNDGAQVTMRDKVESTSSARRAIAIPGRGKYNACTKEFQGLWSFALSRIRSARSLVCIGYGFPESDVFAISKIGEAMAEADSLCYVHVVLGLDDDRRARRVEELMKAACYGKPTSVIRHSLYGQDLMSLFTRDMLTPD
jgi:hypothetical protein